MRSLPFRFGFCAVHFAVWGLRLLVALFSIKKVCCCGCCCCCSYLFCEASSHVDARIKALLQARCYTRSRSRTQTCTRTRTRTKPKLTRTRKTMRTIYRKDETETVSHSLIKKFETKKKNYKFETVARPPITKFLNQKNGSKIMSHPGDGWQESVRQSRGLMLI